MTFALQNALLHPERCPGVESSLDFSKTMDLSFSPPDLNRYPCLKLAKDALSQGGSAPLAFNASNEIAVDAFRLNRIGFIQISDIIDKTLNQMSHAQPNSLDELLAVDLKVRRLANDFVTSTVR
jgi:1-deoxy-D-xylulose-5-phosphate reductoisomerase